MLSPNVKKYMIGAYAQLGKYGYDMTLNLLNGKDHTLKQQKLLWRSVHIWLILKVLYRHVDISTTQPTLYRITEEEVNIFIRRLGQLAELNDYPVVPSIIPGSKPVVVSELSVGPQGEPGADGNDANIVVESVDEQEELVVTEVVVEDVKTYRLNYIPYVLPSLSISEDSLLFQIGNEEAVTFTLTITKGRNNIVSIVCDDAGIDAILQPLINLTTLNGVSQPNNIVVVTPDQDVDKTVTFTITDSLGGEVVVEKLIKFYYPFVYGTSGITNIDFYIDLSKLLEAKSDKAIVLNGSDCYFYFGYPSSYGSLTAVRDSNGVNVLASFTELTEDLTSTGLDNNWIDVEYTIYRTTIKTSIDSELFTFEF